MWNQKNVALKIKIWDQDSVQKDYCVDEKPKRSKRIFSEE